MPAVPKFREAFGKIRNIEVGGKLDAKQSTYTSYNARISSKIIVQPEGVDDQPANQFQF